MDISIIGRGVFGSFLAEEFKPHANIVDDADIVIAAVPVSSMEDVARTYAGRHLVNVCSVQDKPNAACLKYSARVTGIHPMFGPQSPRANRTCVATQTCAESEDVFNVFRAIGADIVTTHNGMPMTGALHDAMMRRTHLPVLMFGELAALIVEQASDIPDNFLPTSFKRLKALAEQMKDMSPGTVESIRSNL